MADRRALVLDNGLLKELPTGDFLSPYSPTDSPTFSGLTLSSAELGLQPGIDLGQNNIPILQWGQDPNVYYNGNPLQILWSNPDTGQGALIFQDTAGNQSYGLIAQYFSGNHYGTWGGSPIGTTVGGTGLSGYTTGDLIYASATNTLAKRASVSAGSYLRSEGVTTAPVWSTLKLPNGATANRIPYATSLNTWGDSASLTFNGTSLALSGNLNVTGGTVSDYDTTSGTFTANTLTIDSTFTGFGFGAVGWNLDMNHSGNAGTVTGGSILVTGSGSSGQTTQGWCVEIDDSSSPGIGVGASIRNANVVNGSAALYGTINNSPLTLITLPSQKFAGAFDGPTYTLCSSSVSASGTTNINFSQALGTYTGNVSSSATANVYNHYSEVRGNAAVAGGPTTQNIYAYRGLATTTITSGINTNNFFGGSFESTGSVGTSANHNNYGVQGISSGGKLNTAGNMQATSASGTTAVGLNINVSGAGTNYGLLQNSQVNSGIGTSTPNYRLDVVNTSGASQIRFGNSSSQNGGNLMSNGASAAYLLGGCDWNGSATVARSTEAQIYGGASGGHYWWSDTALTSGNSFTATLRMQLTTTGQLGLGPTLPASYSQMHISKTDDPVLVLEDVGNGVGYLAQDATQTILGCENNFQLKTGITFATGPIATGTTRLRYTAASGTFWLNGKTYVNGNDSSAMLGNWRLGVENNSQTGYAYTDSSLAVGRYLDFEDNVGGVFIGYNTTDKRGFITTYDMSLSATDLLIHPTSQAARLIQGTTASMGRGGLQQIYGGDPGAATIMWGRQVRIRNTGDTTGIRFYDGNMGYLTTTNATTTTVATISVPSSTVINIEIIVSAIRTGGISGTTNDCGTYRGAVMLSRDNTNTSALVNGGTGTVPINAVSEIAAFSGCKVEAVRSGTNVLVQVTGLANYNITWGMTFNNLEVQS